SLLRAADVDAAVGRDLLAVPAEAAHQAGGDRALHDQVERAGALGAPGQSVEGIRLDVILDDGQVPIAVVRLVETRPGGGPAPDVDLQYLGEVRVIAQRLRVPALLHPRVRGHSA